MSEIRKDGDPFVGYEYKEIAAAGEQAAFYLDCYQNFGWQMDERLRDNSTKGKLVLKRERKIINKAELTRLQRHFEACMEEIAALERSRTTAASAVALIIGVVGTVFMAGATFAAVHVPPMWGLMAVLAVPGFLGWVLPLFVYQSMVSRRSRVVEELVERKYDEIHEICEQGNSLLL